MTEAAETFLPAARPPTLVARGWRLARSPSGNVVLALALGLTMLGLMVPPLVTMVRLGFTADSLLGAGAFTLDQYASVFANLTAGADVLLNSLVFAVGSAALALVLGTATAWIAERTNAPFQRLAYVAAFTSFAIPGIIKLVAWILLLGPQAGFVNKALVALFGLSGPPINIFSLGGMVFLEGLFWSPVVFLLMGPPLRSMDPSLEEAAAMSGAGPLRAFRSVTARLMLPSALAVLFLTLVRSLESFEVPALIGIPAHVELFTTEIFLKVSSGGLTRRYGEASAYSTVLIMLIVVGLIPYYRLTRNAEAYATVTGKGFRPRVRDLGRWRYFAGLVLLIFPFFEFLPLLAIAWASLLPFIQAPSPEALKTLTLANYPKAFSNSNVSVAIVNSAIVSTASAFGVVALTLLTGWVVVRTRVRGRWLLDQLASVPLAFPAIVLGLAMLRTYVASPIPIYGTIWILVVTYVTRFMPFGMRYAYAGLLTIHRELEESAATSGASPWLRLRRIVVPLMLPSLFAAWIQVFLISTRELSAALLLSAPGSQVISVAFWELWGNGQITDLSAFAVVITAGLMLLSVGLLRLTRGRAVSL